MSWVHLNDTHPKARKAHTCDLCGLAIPKGEKYIARRGIDDGPLTMHMHSDCEPVTDTWREEDWEAQDVFEFRAEKERFYEKQRAYEQGVASKPGRSRPLAGAQRDEVKEEVNVKAKSKELDRGMRELGLKLKGDAPFMLVPGPKYVEIHMHQLGGVAHALTARTRWELFKAFWFYWKKL